MNIRIFLLAILTIGSTSLFGQRKVETTFRVDGNCEMCKKRIERALDVPGVLFAEWNVTTKELFVSYRPKKLTETDIHRRINEAGHDTEKSSASDSVYENLHSCCLYRGAPEIIPVSDTIPAGTPDHIMRHE